MKTPSKILVLGYLMLLVGAAASHAAVVSLNASDIVNTSSFNAAGQWSNGQAPSGANDYFISTFFLRPPTGSANFPFAGNSLTLQAPTGQGDPPRSLLYKGSGGNVYTINNLTNAGGVINSGAGNATAPTFTGNLMTVVANSAIQPDQGHLIIGYQIAGSANVPNSGPSDGGQSDP